MHNAKRGWCNIHNDAVCVGAKRSRYRNAQGVSVNAHQVDVKVVPFVRELVERPLRDVDPTPHICGVNVLNRMAEFESPRSIHEREIACSCNGKNGFEGGHDGARGRPELYIAMSKEVFKNA